MVKVTNIIAAVSPDLYCKENKRKEVKELIKTEGYAKAAEKAEIIDANEIFDIHFTQEGGLKSPKPLDALGLKSPLVKHTLVYDSPTETLEPIYFWVLDFMENMFPEKD